MLNNIVNMSIRMCTSMADVRNEISHKFCCRSHRLLEEVDNNRIESLSKGWKAPEGLLLTKM
jgi:hypothetical protein